VALSVDLRFCLAKAFNLNEKKSEYVEGTLIIVYFPITKIPAEIEASHCVALYVGSYLSTVFATCNDSVHCIRLCVFVTKTIGSGACGPPAKY
jgi:hypothetical protein